MAKQKFARRLKKTEKKSLVKGKSKAKAKSYKKKVLKKKSILERITSYFRNVRLELKKVIWPNRDTIVSYTIVTLTTIIIFVIFIGLCDFLFTQLILFLQKIKF